MGNDKGKVEGFFGYCRRNFLVPMPRFQTFDGLNAHLEACCRKRWAERLRGHGETIGERLERDRAILQPLPATPYDACDKRAGRVSSLSLVRYRGTDYSVPARFGHYEVLVRGYVHEVVISHGADVIARHPRSYEHQQIDVCPPTGPAHAGLEQIDRPIRDEAKLARHDPAMLAAFRALRLNQGTSDVEVATLLDAGLWASIEGEAERAGSPVWGIDLGTSQAQSAIAAFWPGTGALSCIAAFPEQPAPSPLVPALSGPDEGQGRAPDLLHPREPLQRLLVREQRRSERAGRTLSGGHGQRAPARHNRGTSRPPH